VEEKGVQKGKSHFSGGVNPGRRVKGRSGQIHGADLLGGKELWGEILEKAHA